MPLNIIEFTGQSTPLQPLESLPSRYTVLVDDWSWYKRSPARQQSFLDSCSPPIGFQIHLSTYLFLELTYLTIQEGVDQCVNRAIANSSVLPILLFAARHNKFDTTNARQSALIPVKFHCHAVISGNYA